jgi:hypothetical protein
MPRLVRNVTDVDDDILRRTRELGAHYLDLAPGEMARFDEDMAFRRLLSLSITTTGPSGRYRRMTERASRWDDPERRHHGDDWAPGLVTVSWA